ncbi:hypothetical protein H0E87_000547 [Populus deltoides]|uniref:Uncharacterized protein n=1 Tax=Populus deltoides TaxID=3696 RepID=A0A8T2ZMQ6_POPDE|nr:hypothetical protein H0E87_000547 [Populus deltoides]
MGTSMHQDNACSINMEHIFDGYREGERAATAEEYIERFKDTIPQSLAELIDKNSTSQYPVKFIIYDSILPWVLDVAKSWGIEGEKSPVSLPSLPQLEFSDLPSLVHGPGSYPGIYDLLFSQFSNIDEASWLLWNTFNELEDEIVDWMASKWPIKLIGPTIPSMFLDKRLEDDKDYGVRVKVGENGMVTQEEIERCIREVMMEGERRDEIRTHSEKWKKLAEMAMDEGGSSDKNIEEFVASLNACNSNSTKNPDQRP